MLSEIFGDFGDFENFVNVIGKHCGEVWSGVPGHVSAERNFTNIIGVLNVPDLRHAAPRPGSPGAPGILQDVEVHTQLH